MCNMWLCKTHSIKKYIKNEFDILGLGVKLNLFRDTIKKYYFLYIIQQIFIKVTVSNKFEWIWSLL